MFFLFSILVESIIKTAAYFSKKMTSLGQPPTISLQAGFIYTVYPTKTRITSAFDFSAYHELKYGAQENWIKNEDIDFN